MRRRLCLVALLTLPLLAAAPVGRTSHPVRAATQSKSGAEQRFQAAYASLPMSFEANRGQVDGAVKFLARGVGYALFLTRGGAVLALQSGAAEKGKRLVGLGHEGTVDFLPIGASAHSRIVGVRRLPGIVNYFQGKDPGRWLTDIPAYAQVVYRDVYPGIDLIFHGNDGHLEYDWLLAPGAHPQQIRLQVGGGTDLRIGSSGDLLLNAGGSLIRQEQPVVYQILHGHRQLVRSHYVLSAHREIQFALGRYDKNRSLIIDPTLIYSTYLGGNSSDGAFDVAVDGQGHAYLTGDTFSLNFPKAHPLQPTLTSDPSCLDYQSVPGGPCSDVFVSKMSADGGALLYSTYLGGTEDDSGHAIAVDSSGNAYITGNTLSSDFPVRGAIQSQFGGGSVLGDAFVTELDAGGNALVYSTYLGGSGDDDGNGIAVWAGSTYVTGRTNSPNFPTAHPFQAEPGGGTCAYDFDPNAMAPCYDAFVAKLGPGGSTLKYGTYLGGSDTDFAWGIAVRDGNAYVAGQASSSDFPTANPLQPSIGGGTCGAQDTSAPCSDAFVAELNTAGDSLIYSTYLGGGADDSADAIAVDTAGNAYVVGATYSTNFPTAHAFQRTYLGSDNGMAFVSKLNAAGNALVYSTYLGGSGSDEAYGVALDRSGDAYVTGRTSSPDFPLLRAIQTRLPGDAYPQNAFVTALSPHGSSLLYSTFLGGNDHDSGNGIAVDGAGNAYVAGYASSKDFPVAHALQRALAGGTYDVFVAKVGNPSAALSHTPTATIRPTPTSTATRSPPSKPATSRTIKCKKGYRLVQGKCRKQKKHS